MALLGIDRKKIPWYPTIDLNKCSGNKECYNFCKNNVFSWDEAHSRPIVENPYNCVLGCNACEQICPHEAISFPPLEEIRNLMKKLREEAA